MIKPTQDFIPKNQTKKDFIYICLGAIVLNSVRKI